MLLSCPELLVQLESAVNSCVLVALPNNRSDARHSGPG